jgi:hypothetical protein
MRIIGFSPLERNKTMSTHLATGAILIAVSGVYAVKAWHHRQHYDVCLATAYVLLAVLERM